MRPEQLADFRVPSDAHLHPSGGRALFTVRQLDLEDDASVSRIWLWDGDATRQLSSGKADSHARWAPDGDTIAFLRKGPEKEDRPQLALMPADGGEASVVTELPLGVTAFAWSPDGSRILLQAAEHVDGHESEDERTRAPRRIQHPAFRFDGLGWLSDKRSHIHVFDRGTGAVDQITSGDTFDTSGSWSPDGQTVAFVTTASEAWWRDGMGRVATVPAAGGNVTFATGFGDWTWSGYSTDGSLYVLGTETDRFVLKAAPLQRVETDGTLTRITDLDRQLRPGHPGGEMAGPRFLADGSMHVLLEDRGSQCAVSLGVEGEVAGLAEGDRLITGWDPAPDGGSAIITVTTPTDPAYLAFWDGESEVKLTDFNDVFATEANLVQPQEFTFENDGHEIHGWVLLPEGDGPVPTLLNIHGGPATQYGWGFFDEWQVYVGAGYGVVAMNPRGSSGYGDEHMRVPIGRWADDVPPDQDDLMKAPFEAAKQFPRLDTERLGIMGGSYGGLSTAMITALDQRYKSAVAERGVYNWLSMAGTTDIPWFTEVYLEAKMPDGPLKLWEASPLARAHKITTPTLVLHSETDYRCPVEQGQQFFSVLYGQGVETELLLFPSGEGHELSRSGTPKHRVERFEAILDWHAKYLI